jgi:RNA polymerase sigma-70 factor (sigma-E family)
MTPDHRAVATLKDGHVPSQPISRARAEFEAFFQAHHRELGRLAYTLTGDSAEADDVAGEALAAAWQSWERVRMADRPLAYVRRIVVNLAAQRVRTLVKERHGITVLGRATRWIDHGPDIGGNLDLQAAILLLPPRRRACVVLRHVFDLPEDEVARCLGISVGTVKSQTSKGLAQLRRTMIDAADLPSSPAQERRYER